MGFRRPAREPMEVENAPKIGCLPTRPPILLFNLAVMPGILDTGRSARRPFAVIPVLWLGVLLREVRGLRPLAINCCGSKLKQIGRLHHETLQTLDCRQAQ